MTEVSGCIVVDLVGKLPLLSGLKTQTSFWIMHSLGLILLKMTPLSAHVPCVGTMLDM
jgi:hypothetical protein